MLCQVRHSIFFGAILMGLGNPVYSADFSGEDEIGKITSKFKAMDLGEDEKGALGEFANRIFLGKGNENILRNILMYMDYESNTNIRLVSKKCRKNANEITQFPTLIYHFTHIDNLENIVSENKILSHNNAKRLNPRDVSNNEIQDRRDGKEVHVGYNLHDYVPFYYNPRSPMLYRVTKNYNNETRRVDPKDIVFFVTYAQRLEKVEGSFAITNMNAAKNNAEIWFGPNDLYKLNWKEIRASFWDKNNPGPRQAEFLALGEVPLSSVRKIMTYDKVTGAKVLKKYPKLNGRIGCLDNKNKSAYFFN